MLLSEIFIKDLKDFLNTPKLLYSVEFFSRILRIERILVRMPSGWLLSSPLGEDGRGLKKATWIDVGTIQAAWIRGMWEDCYCWELSRILLTMATMSEMSMEPSEFMSQMARKTGSMVALVLEST